MRPNTATSAPAAASGATKRSSRTATPPRLPVPRPDGLGEPRTGPGDDPGAVGMVGHQPAEAFALQGPGRGEDADDAGAGGVRRRGFDAGLQGHHRQRERARMASAAAAVAVLQAMTKALAPRRARASAMTTPARAGRAGR